MSTVLLCPPRRPSASYRVTRSRRESSSALARPAMPEPTTAIRRRPPVTIPSSSPIFMLASARVQSFAPETVAQAEWLWMDSKFSEATCQAAMRGSARRRRAMSRTRSSTNFGLS